MIPDDRIKALAQGAASRWQAFEDACGHVRSAVQRSSASGSSDSDNRGDDSPEASLGSSNSKDASPE